MLGATSKSPKDAERPASIPLPPSSIESDAHRIYQRLIVALAKNGTAGDEGISPGVGDAANVVHLDATINFEANILAAGGDATAHRFDLAQRGVNEALATEARVDAHDENQVNVFNHPVQQPQRLGRVEGQTALAALGLDDLQAAMHMA